MRRAWHENKESLFAQCTCQLRGARCRGSVRQNSKSSSPKIIITQNHHHVFCDADMVLHFLTLSALSAATP